jgi:hypothetical protein
MHRPAELMGWSTDWPPDDFLVIDQERSVGRIYREAIHGELEWHWSINTSPYSAPPPHSGVTKTLDAAKQAFKARYEEMKRMGVRPFG